MSGFSVMAATASAKPSPQAIENGRELSRAPEQGYAAGHTLNADRGLSAQDCCAAGGRPDLVLRGYEVAHVAALRDAFRRHRRVVSVAPTGSGKTREVAFIVASAAMKHRRTIFTVHRAELLDQASAAFGAAVRLGLLPHTASRRQDCRPTTAFSACSCLRLAVATNSPRQGLSPPIQCPCQAHPTPPTITPNNPTRRIYADSDRHRHRAAMLHGGLAEAERRARDAAFGDGRLAVLAVVDFVTEGYDVPGIEVVIHLRPTASVALCRQINGRGLRPKPDGAPCLILDHVANVGRHGLPDEEIERTLDGRAKRAATIAPAAKQCPNCWCCHVPAPVCPECGHVYPQRVRRRVLVERAGNLAEITAREVERYRAAKLRDLVRAAGSIEELRAIGRARGYHPRWAARAAQIWRKPFAAAGAPA